MFFESWNDFLNMGGYGFYVWLAYGISAVTITVFAIQSVKAKNAVFNEIRKQRQREARMRQGRKTDTGEML